MSKLASVDALQEVIEKLRENATKQDELAQTRQQLVDEEIDLLEKLGQTREGLADDENAPPPRAAPQQARKKPGPKPGAKKPAAAPKASNGGGGSGKGGKGRGKGQNSLALHTMIRNQLIAPAMPEGVPFAEIVRNVTRWINIGKYKSTTDNVTNICSQAMNKLKKDDDVHQPGGNRSHYMLTKKGSKEAEAAETAR